MTQKNPITDAYIRQRYGNLPAKNIRNIREAMGKYEDNHWWESEDPTVIAMYQIFENVLLSDLRTFHEGLEKLVGRPVFTHELGLNLEGVRKEASLGIERLKKGIRTSDEYKETAVRKSIKMLEDYCRRTGKPFIKVDLTPKDPKRRKTEVDNSGYDGWLNPDND